MQQTFIIDYYVSATPLRNASFHNCKLIVVLQLLLSFSVTFTNIFSLQAFSVIWLL